MLEYITDHYIFTYKEMSLAEKDIKLIAKEQENCFQRICSVLKINFFDKIHYYLLDSPEEVGKLYGDNEPINGFAVWGENKIYAVYNDDIKCIGPHEDTHLISFAINAPKSDFIVEGLAMYFDEKWWNVDNDEWASYYKNVIHELSICKLLDNQQFDMYGCEITYPIAGAFTKFLIDKYGINKYLLLYKYDGTDYGDAIKDIYGHSALQIEIEFWNKIESVDFNQIMLKSLLEKYK